MSPTMELLSQLEQVDSATPFAYVKIYVSQVSIVWELFQVEKATSNVSGWHPSDVYAARLNVPVSWRGSFPTALP